MTAEPEANKFGEFLMVHLRDEAIDQFDRLVAGEDKSSLALSAVLSQLTPELKAAVRRAVVGSLDYGLHAFLFTLSAIADRDDEDEIELPQVIVTVDGENVAGQSDGLHGELFGDDGWLATFSRHGESS